jgi:hypothetical protein
VETGDEFVPESSTDVLHIFLDDGKLLDQDKKAALGHEGTRTFLDFKGRRQ